MPSKPKFTREGGRAGWIRFEENGASGRLDWEGLMGEIGMAIYAGNCSWTAPREQQITADDLRRLVQEFADEVKFPVELVFAGVPEAEVMRPRTTPPRK
jgi:hypothetical protein